ncbi:hypothetical protein G6F50_015295 [Rhizopus delemar]|uniref:Uncharacterized protein n=1 Tax=Rhizopus delemar TaxID=936053 RepID=A0A9P6XYM9_9FUNG|nr:hypothetical protein G6F50_015295 [Rhizopus delemar]
MRKRAGAIRMADHLGAQLRMLVERTRDAVEHRQQRVLQLRLVRVERHAAGNIDLEAAVGHFHDIDPQGRRARLLHVILNDLPVVPDQSPRHRAAAGADGRPLAVTDQGADTGADRRARAGAHGGVRLLLRGAPRQQRARRRDYRDPVEYCS